MPLKSASSIFGSTSSVEPVGEIGLALEHLLDLDRLLRHRHLGFHGELEAALVDDLGVHLAHDRLDGLDHHGAAVELLEMRQRHLAGPEAVDADLVLELAEPLHHPRLEGGSRHLDVEFALETVGNVFCDLHGDNLHVLADTADFGSVIWLHRAWCGRRGSNPHDFRHGNLNPARLPIPPRPRRAPRRRTGSRAARLITARNPWRTLKKRRRHKNKRRPRTSQPAGARLSPERSRPGAESGFAMPPSASILSRRRVLAAAPARSSPALAPDRARKRQRRRPPTASACCVRASRRATGPGPLLRVKRGEELRLRLHQRAAGRHRHPLARGAGRPISWTALPA